MELELNNMNPVLKEQYLKEFLVSKLNMRDFLMQKLPPEGTTIGQAFDIYVELMTRIYGDSFLVLTEDKVFHGV